MLRESAAYLPACLSACLPATDRCLLQVCIPGGHKARYQYPGGGSSVDAIDGPSVKHISVLAGDVYVVLFVRPAFAAPLKASRHAAASSSRVASLTVSCPGTVSATDRGPPFLLNRSQSILFALTENNTTERRCVIQFNSSRNRAILPGQALGTAQRNHPQADHADSGGVEGAFGLPGQEAPGWDLDAAGFETLCRDLGFASAEDYIAYKAATSVRQPARL